MMIANGDDPEILTKIYTGEEYGTVFFPRRRLPARKRWVRFAPVPSGSLVVDDGAAQALEQQGKSLLPIGVLNCFGRFKKGDVVSIVDRENREIARGLANYGHKEVAMIRGRRASEIAEILGFCPYDEIVHRDNIQINADFSED
jgi:glutamate 5-kinase